MVEEKKSYEVLNYASEPFLIEDTESECLVFANSAAVDILEVSSEELIGKRLQSYLTLFSMPGAASAWKIGPRVIEMKEYKFNGSNNLKLIKLAEIAPPVSKDDLEMLNRVSAVFRHRLHSPLNAVGGFFELVKENLDDHDHAHEMEAINGGIENMAAILESVKFIEELKDAEKKPCDVAIIIDEIKQNFTPSELQHVRWNVKVNRPLETDEIILKELVTTLLRNALDANENDFQKVEVEIEMEMEKESKREQRGDVRIRIRNYGTIIPKRHIAKLFKPFFTTKAQNLGLGLTKAYLLIQKLNGFLYLRSNSKVDGICFEAIL